MFVAMNRFRVVRGEEDAFEAVWRDRDRHIEGTPGFLGFCLLRGPQGADHTLYCSHSQWASRAAFEAWMRSDAFRAAHRDAGAAKPLYLGPPEFEGFETVAGV